MVGQTAKSYAIRLPFPLGGHKANKTIVVRKHNVELEEVEEAIKATVEDAPVQQYDYTGAWWND